MELNDISISENKHEEKTVIIKTNTAGNKIEENLYVNTSLVVDTSVLDKRESHVYDHLQRTHDNASNCKEGCITRFKQYKDCIMLSLIGVLFIAVTVLAIFIGLPEKTAIDGSWSPWSAWGSCSATCDTGLQRRNRTCSNPAQDLHGRPCVGDFSDHQICASTFCKAINGGWSAWSAWGTCSATCGTGLQSRNRTCSNPEPELNGRTCVGDFSDHQLCAPTSCEGNFYAENISGTKIGFSVYNPLNPVYGSNVKFRNALYNYNNVYNTTTGEFVCTKRGLYYFQITLIRQTAVYTPNSVSSCALSKNYAWQGVYMYITMNSSLPFSQATASFILDLIPRDWVYITDCYNIAEFYYYSTFSGFLINTL